MFLWISRGVQGTPRQEVGCHAENPPRTPISHHLTSRNGSYKPVAYLNMMSSSGCNMVTPRVNLVAAGADVTKISEFASEESVCFKT